MNASEYFRVLTTDGNMAYDGRPPSALFLFAEPVRAAQVFRFAHKRHSTCMHIFADSAESPLAIQFRHIDKAAIGDASNQPDVDQATVRARLFDFAKFMIAYAKIQRSKLESQDDSEPEDSYYAELEDTDDCDEHYPVFKFHAPDVPEVDDFIDEARLVAQG